jgi:hypothetical protein
MPQGGTLKIGVALQKEKGGTMDGRSISSGGKEVTSLLSMKNP